jgi:hypothetical protein
MDEGMAEQAMRYTVVMCKAADGRIKVKREHTFGPVSRRDAFFEAIKEFGSIEAPKDGWYVIAISPGQHDVFYFEESEV